MIFDIPATPVEIVKVGHSALRNGTRNVPRGLFGTPKIFSGRARVRSICGWRAVDLSSNAHRLERTHQDVRADARDHYYAIFQMTGHSRIIQNDGTVELAVGDVALVDAARPVTYVSEKEGDQWWGSLQLPRGSLLSHLGLEPRCPARRSGAAAARPLRQLLLDDVEDQKSMSVSANGYMRLAIYDLLGAFFSHRSIQKVLLFIQTSCSLVSAISSRITLPIRTSVLATWRSRRESHYATFRSSLRRETRPAVTSYIRFVWITPRIC
jgi:hypothetical protein